MPTTCPLGDASRSFEDVFRDRAQAKDPLAIAAFDSRRPSHSVGDVAVECVFRAVQLKDGGRVLDLLFGSCANAGCNVAGVVQLVGHLVQSARQ